MIGAAAGRPIRSRLAVVAGGQIPLPRMLTLALRWAKLVVGSLMFATVLALDFVPLTGLYSTFIVLSPSMEPAIPTGAMVFVLPVNPREVRTGDVITFTSALEPHPTLSHRVQAIYDEDDGAIVFKTKGDANPTVDPWEVRYKGPAGKVVFTLPLAGYVMAFATDLPARIGLGLLLACLLGARLLRAIWSRTH